MRTITPRVERVSDHRAGLGESVFYDATSNRLFWIDIPERRLLRTDATSGATVSIDLDEMPGFVHPCRCGNLLLGLTNTVRRVSPDAGQSSVLLKVEPGDPSVRSNDVACSPHGALVFGTMRPTPQPGVPDPVGGLYSLLPSGRSECLRRGLRIPNGLAFSPDGDRLYWADTPARRIWRARLEGGAERLVEIEGFAALSEEQGRPDGATVDAAGCYWIAAVWGWSLMRYTPDGRLDLVVRLPVERPTKLAFGGPGNRTIFVTSASRDLHEPQKQPLAGHLIALDIGIEGLPACAF